MADKFTVLGIAGSLRAGSYNRLALRAAQQGPEVGSRTEIEDKLKAICDTALEGKRVDIHDNLFEVGASSLKLIEIHERIVAGLIRSSSAISASVSQGSS